MSHFIIDKDKCKRDGICAAECPIRIIEFKKDNMPTPVENAEQLCIHCGHCVAVCPHGAFSLSDMKSEDCPPVRKEMALSIGQVEHFLRSRRSIRTYQEKETEKEKIAKLIDIARYAPTGRNSQMIRWLVINSRETVRNMAALLDSTIALTFLDLAAPSFALGTCWAGFFMMAASHWSPLQQTISLPEGHACFGAMMIGYPKYKYQRLPLRKEADILWHEK